MRQQNLEMSSPAQLITNVNSRFSVCGRLKTICIFAALKSRPKNTKQTRVARDRAHKSSHNMQMNFINIELKAIRKRQWKKYEAAKLALKPARPESHQGAACTAPEFARKSWTDSSSLHQTVLQSAQVGEREMWNCSVSYLCTVVAPPS